TVPSCRAAPSGAATPAKAAPIPTRPAPTGGVPAITVPSPEELNRLHRSKLIRRHPQAVGINQGGMSAPADHGTHDRERCEQCQAEFAHCIFLYKGIPMGRFEWTSVIAQSSSPDSQPASGVPVASRSWTRGKQKEHRRA